MVTVSNPNERQELNQRILSLKNALAATRYDLINQQKMLDTAISLIKQNSKYEAQLEILLKEKENRLAYLNKIGKS